MTLFTNQPMFCPICGIKFMYDFNYHGIPACNKECWEEYQRRKSLSIMGEKYSARNN